MGSCLSGVRVRYFRRWVDRLKYVSCLAAIESISLVQITLMSQVISRLEYRIIITVVFRYYILYLLEHQASRYFKSNR